MGVCCKLVQCLPRHRACLDVVVLVQGESMVDALRQHDHVALAAADADPALLLVPHVKIACTPIAQSWDISEKLHVTSALACSVAAAVRTPAC